jgi:predicted Zn-dependent peptidase
MNKLKLLLGIVLLAFIGNIVVTNAQMPKPEPTAPKDFVFPNYKTVVLSNGIKVFLIKDAEQPTLSIRMVFSGGANLDGKKTGVAEITTSLMSKGAGKLDALAIAEQLDGIGAGVGVSAGQDMVVASGSSLVKHFDKMFDIFADIILRPKFPKDEFEKLIQQSISGVKMRKSNSDQIVSMLTSVATYGKDHPYAQIETEETYKALTTDDCKAYYKSVFMPNNVTISIIGDYNEKDIIKSLENKFKDWQKGQRTSMDIPEPKPMQPGVYMIPRPGSKQASIVISGLTVPRNHPDYLAVRLTGAVMGGGFGSKLFRSIREKYSFTYSPFASNSGNKFANRFMAGSEVKIDKTDSSLIVILDDLKSLYNDGLSDEELARTKKTVIGGYQMGFESSGFVASLIQNADFYGEDIETIKNYPRRVQAITTLDIAKVTEKYLKQNKLFIGVVTLPEQEEELKKYGNIYKYTLDLESEDEIAKATPVNYTANELLQKFETAMGGLDAINSVKTMKVESRVKLQAQGQILDGNAVQITEFPDKSYSFINTPAFQQASWINGVKAWVKQGPETTELTGEEFQQALEQVKDPLFELVMAPLEGFKYDLIGEKDGFVKLKVTDKKGEVETYLFDKSTFLVSKIQQTATTPQGPMDITITYSEYETIKGVKYPMRSEMSNPYYSLISESVIYFNDPVTPDTFQPKQ